MSPVITALLPVLETLFRYVWDKYDSADDAWSEVKSSLAGGKITKPDLPDLEADIAALHARADREDPGAVLAAISHRRDAGGFTAPDPLGAITEPPPPAPPTLRPEGNE